MKQLFLTISLLASMASVPCYGMFRLSGLAFIPGIFGTGLIALQKWNTRKQSHCEAGQSMFNPLLTKTEVLAVALVRQERAMERYGRLVHGNVNLDAVGQSNFTAKPYNEPGAATHNEIVTAFETVGEYYDHASRPMTAEVRTALETLLKHNIIHHQVPFAIDELELRRSSYRAELARVPKPWRFDGDGFVRAIRTVVRDDEVLGEID